MSGARTIVAAVAAALAAAASAAAQEAINTSAATQPGKGVFSYRQQLRYTHYDNDPTDLDREVDEWVSKSMISYGITGNLSATLEVPFIYQDVDSSEGDESDFGIDDLRLMFKYRLWQNDYGPTSTARVSVMGGARIPTFDSPFSTESFNPILGAVYTHIHERHGWNASLHWDFTTGGDSDPLRPRSGLADALSYDAAYLYRLSPAEYAADTAGSWYIVAELNGVYETNGDNEILLAPGILYEAREFALEASVQLPAAQDLDHRPEREVSVVVGVRLLF